MAKKYGDSMPYTSNYKYFTLYGKEVFASVIKVTNQLALRIFPSGPK